MNFYRILLFLLFPLFSYSQSVLNPFQAENGMFGYKNQKNKIIIQPAFNTALLFEKKHALVCQNNKWGIINEKGIWVIPATYDTLQRFSEVLLAGNRKIHPDTLSGIRFSEEMYYGLISYDNRIIQPLRFKKIEDTGKSSFLLTSFNRYEVKKNNAESIITIECDKIQLDSLPEELPLDTIPLEYDWRMPHKLGKTWGFIDSIGLMRISNRYEQVRSFHEKVAAVKFNGGWGFIDKRESIVVQPNYEWVSDMKNGLAIAKQKGKYSIVAKNGREQMKFIYDTLYRHPTGVFVSRKANKEGIIGINGYEVLPPRFDKVSPQTDYHTIVQRGNLYGLFSENGSIVFPIQYDGIFYEPSGRKYVIFTKEKKIPFTQ